MKMNYKHTQFTASEFGVRFEGKSVGKVVYSEDRMVYVFKHDPEAESMPAEAHREIANFVDKRNKETGN